MLKNFNAVPGFYAAGIYVNCQVIEAGLKATGGDIGDKDKFIAALRAVKSVRHAARSDQVRPFRQCHRHVLHPALRHRGRQIRAKALE